MASHLIRYRLFGISTGQPFKGSTASSVARPSTFVIDQLRDAVQAKWDIPGFLKDVPAGALKQGGL